MTQRKLWRIRKTVQRLFPTDGKECEVCHATGRLHRHHRDLDITNNPINGSNISYLCKGCHNIVHSGVGYKLRNLLALAAV